MGLDEEVLCIPRNAIPMRLLGKRSAVSLAWDDMRSTLDRCTYNFKIRREIEHDFSYKQIIPYVLLRNSSESYFCYERRGTERRLHGNLSLGIGGHIAKDDAEEGEVFLDSLVQQGMMRELSEETGYSWFFDIRFLGVINEEESEVGIVHFGMVFSCSIGDQDKELVMGDGELVNQQWRSIPNIKEHSDEFELWSQLALELI